MRTFGLVKRSELPYIKERLEALDIPFATPSHAENDFRSPNIQMFVLRENKQPVAICSVVYDLDFQYHALKRMIVLDKDNRGRGYAKVLTARIIARTPGACGCTPWADNVHCQRMLASLGFKYQYTFNNNWTFWKVG